MAGIVYDVGMRFHIMGPKRIHPLLECLAISRYVAQVTLECLHDVNHPLGQAAPASFPALSTILVHAPSPCPIERLIPAGTTSLETTVKTSVYAVASRTTSTASRNIKAYTRYDNLTLVMGLSR